MRILGYVLIIYMLYFSLVMSTQEGGFGSGFVSGAGTTPKEGRMMLGEVQLLIYIAGALFAVRFIM